jgi:hypothetical protein
MNTTTQTGAPSTVDAPPSEEFDINLDAETSEAASEEDEREFHSERFISGLGRSVIRLVAFHTREGVFRTINERIYRKVGLLKPNGKLLEIPVLPKEIDPVNKAKMEIKDLLIRWGKADDKSVWKHALMKRCYDDTRPWGAGILYQDSSTCPSCYDNVQLRASCSNCKGMGVIDPERRKRDPYVVGEVYLVRLDMGKPKMAQIIEDWVKQPGNDPTHARTGYPIALVGVKDERNRYNNYSMEPLREYRGNAGIYLVKGQLSSRQLIDIEIVNFYRGSQQAGDEEVKRRIIRANQLQSRLGSKKLLQDLTTGKDAESKRREIYDFLKAEVQRVLDGTSNGDLPKTGDAPPNVNTQPQTQQQNSTQNAQQQQVQTEPKAVSQTKPEPAPVAPVHVPAESAQGQSTYPLSGEPVLLSDYATTMPPAGRPIVLDDGYMLDRRNPNEKDSKGQPRCFGLLPMIQSPECLACPSQVKNRCVVAKFKREKASKEATPSS